MVACASLRGCRSAIENGRFVLVVAVDFWTMAVFFLHGKQVFWVTFVGITPFHNFFQWHSSIFIFESILCHFVTVNYVHFS